MRTASANLRLVVASALWKTARTKPNTREWHGEEAQALLVGSYSCLHRPLWVRVLQLRVIGAEGIGLRRGVRVHIVADLLGMVVNSKKPGKPQGKEGQRGQRPGPCDNGHNHHKLCCNGRASQALAARAIVTGHAAEAAPAVIVVKAFPPIEETSGEKPLDATGSVHCAGIHGVVDLQSHKEHGRRLVEKSADEAGENRAPALHVSAPSSD